MDITPLLIQGRQIITGYGNGGFRINRDWVEGSILLLPDRRLAWDAKEGAALTIELFQPVLDAQPKIDLLLIGTGKKMQMLDLAIRNVFKIKGIAIDVMDTGAACRTYNVLEERRVAAALMAV